MRCIVNDRKLRDLFYDIHIVNLADRAVLEAVCEGISQRDFKGIFVPDPVLYQVGRSSLIHLVAVWAKAGGSEDVIATSLQRFSEYRILGFTELGHIVVPAVLRSKAHTSAQNGRLSLGRPPKGESNRSYQARSKLHKASILSEATRSPMESEALERQAGKFLTGAELLEMLWKPFSQLQASNEERDQPVTEKAITTPQSPSIVLGAANGKVDAASRVVDQPTITPILPLPTVVAPQLSAPVEKSQPEASIDEEAFLLATEAGKRCHWALDKITEAADVFVLYIRGGLTAKKIKHIVFATTNKCKSVQEYIPKLDRAAENRQG